MDIGTFEVFWNYAVVSDEWESLGNDLTVVAWVSKGLKITVHTRRKYCLSKGNPGGTYTFTFKNLAVFQDQQCFSRVFHTKTKV